MRLNISHALIGYNRFFIVNHFFYILMTCIFLFESMHAQMDTLTSPQIFKYIEIKLGVLSSKDIGAGGIVGVSTATMTDDRIFHGIEINYLKYSGVWKTTTAAALEEDNTINKVTSELRFAMRILIGFYKFDYELELKDKQITLRSSLHFGWAAMWYSEENSRMDNVRTTFFHDIAWQVACGVRIEVSKNASIFFDGIYMYSAPQKEADFNLAGFSTQDVIDISGFGIKFGLNVATKFAD